MNWDGAMVSNPTAVSTILLLHLVDLRRRRAQRHPLRLARGPA